MRCMAKAIRLTLGYDSFTVEGETDKLLRLTFATASEARIAFDAKLANAKKKKRLAPVDATRPGPQADWDGDKLLRVWVTAIETHDKIPNRLASEQLADLDLSSAREVGVGLQQWHDSHKASFDPVVAVLAKKKPPLEALALGDYDNRSGHIMRLNEPAALAALGVKRLRLAAKLRVPDWTWLAALKLDELVVIGDVEAKLAKQLARDVKKLDVKPQRYEGIRE